MSFAGFNSPKFVKGRLQAALYANRKKNRQRRGTDVPIPENVVTHDNEVVTHNGEPVTNGA